jgi:hypothetical protein
MEYDASWPAGLLILAQVVLPILVALVLKTGATGSTRAVTLLALTAVSQVAYGLYDGLPWPALLVNTAVGFAISVATHYGLWKPTGAAYAAQTRGVK